MLNFPLWTFPKLIFFPSTNYILDSPHQRQSHAANVEPKSLAFFLPVQLGVALWLFFYLKPTNRHDRVDVEIFASFLPGTLRSGWWHDGHPVDPCLSPALLPPRTNSAKILWIFENRKFHRYSLHKQSFCRTPCLPSFLSYLCWVLWVDWLTNQDASLNFIARWGWKDRQQASSAAGGG